jgi:hypothetical protein
MDLNDIICKDVRPKYTFHANSRHASPILDNYFTLVIYLSIVFLLKKSKTIDLQLGLYHPK